MNTQTESDCIIQWANKNGRKMTDVVEILTPKEGVTHYMWEDVTVVVKSGINGCDLIANFLPEGW